MSYGMSDPWAYIIEVDAQFPASNPEHYHRGIEHVIYLKDGQLYTEDSKGYKKAHDAGSVQWMSIGKGVKHTEHSGTVHTSKIFAWWSMLPAEKKMIDTKYQEFPEEDITEFSDKQKGVKVRVIAGDSCGLSGKARPELPTLCLDVFLEAGSTLNQAVPVGFRGIIWLPEGESIKFKSSACEEQNLKHQVLWFDVKDEEMSHLELTNTGKSACRFMLLAAKSNNEPIVCYKDPKKAYIFMNTQEEIDQAKEDMEQGKNGFEGDPEWHRLTLQQHIDQTWEPYNTIKKSGHI